MKIFHINNFKERVFLLSPFKISILLRRFFMKRFKYILILSIIFNAYLFSQVEKNEIINVDTVINIDTVVITKADTIVVEEPINTPKEKDENYFYNHGLFSNRTDDGKTDDCKKTGIISVKFGSLILVNVGSVALDIPINCNTNFAARYSYGAVLGNSHDDIFSGFGLGLGYMAKRTNNVIIRFNVYSSLTFIHGNKKPGFGFSIAGDIILWKVFSIGLDSFISTNGFAPFPTVGLNVVY